jgi:hypothetical protein
VTSAVDFVEDANRNGFLAALDIAGYNYVDRYNGNQMYGPEKAKYPKSSCLERKRIMTQAVACCAR